MNQTLADVIGIQPNRRISALQVTYMRAVGDRAMGPDPLGQGDCGWPSKPLPPGDPCDPYVLTEDDDLVAGGEGRR